MDEKSAWAERVRRWGWVAVALGLPGAWLTATYGAALVEDGASPDGFPVIVLLLLTSPILLGARMIRAGYRAERPEPTAAGRQRARRPGGGSTEARRAGALASPRRAVAQAFLGLLVTGVLVATAVPGCACSTRVKAYRAAMKSDLKNLASQQEIYYSDHGTYTHDPVALGFVTSSGVDVTILSSPRGWVGYATHEALGGSVGCAVSWGEAGHRVSTPGGLAPATPGEIVCDET